MVLVNLAECKVARLAKALTYKFFENVEITLILDSWLDLRQDLQR